MKKTIYILFLLLVCLLCLPCDRVSANINDPLQTNAFRIVRKSTLSGEISLIYIFPVNSTLMKNKGFSDEEIEVYKFYLSTYVNALAKSNAEKASDGVSVENSKYFSDVDGIGFSIQFENIEAQKRFFDVNNENESKSNTKKSGFFIQKTKLKTTFPISSTRAAGDLKMICLMSISSWASNNSLSQEKKEAVVSNYENSVFIYDFALQERGLRSELMYQDENFYHNVFIKTIDQIEEDNQICFWTTNINTPFWYLTAIIVVVIGMVCAYVIIKTKQKKELKKKI